MKVPTSDKEGFGESATSPLGATCSVFLRPVPSSIECKTIPIVKGCVEDSMR